MSTCVFVCDVCLLRVLVFMYELFFGDFDVYVFKELFYFAFLKCVCVCVLFLMIRVNAKLIL